MMAFRQVKEALVEVLTQSAQGRYRVLDCQSELAASEVAEQNRTVQVIATTGRFVKSSSSLAGSIRHDPTYEIELMVAATATCDLRTIERPGATQQEISAALHSTKDAEQRADAMMDEFVEIIYQAVMSADRLDLGASGCVDRWIDSWTKDRPQLHGEYVYLTASMPLNCRLTENISGISSHRCKEIVVSCELTNIDKLTSGERVEIAIDTEGN
jgi:hypothetical protein